SEHPDLLLVSVGAMSGVALAVAEKLGAQGISTKVVDPRWVLPVSDDLLELIGSAPAVAVIEDNLVDTGIGSAIAARVRGSGNPLPVWTYGIPKQFLDHGSRGQVLERIGLTPDTIATSLTERLRD
ncbi:MAG: 1-deoxy-D-xylulose-5-phosphate synthase, partial [Actinomycetales bacterium]|nr:1-deoxy-D-xylulose-5-phosphate synthase [Actinomycetales bacterium]